MINDSAKTRTRDEFGRYIKITSKTPSLFQKPTPISGDPPLISVQVTNPVTYLKLWLSKILKNDEIYISIKIRPSAIISAVLALVILFGGFGFGLKYFSWPN